MQLQLPHLMSYVTCDRSEYKWDICHTRAGYHNEIPRLIKLGMSGHIIMLCTVLYIVLVHLQT